MITDTKAIHSFVVLLTKLIPKIRKIFCSLLDINRYLTELLRKNAKFYWV